MVVSLMTGEPDAKLCLELGAALLFDKPILIVSIGDRFSVPERVLRLATEVVHLEEGELKTTGPGAERIAAAVKRMTGTE